jgi:hypothetical protein
MKKRGNADGHIPRSVTRKLLQHGARGTKRVVVIYKNGVPSRVFEYAKHQKVVENARQVKPWEHRTGQTDDLDPLGAIDAGVQSKMSRAEIYE